MRDEQILKNSMKNQNIFPYDIGGAFALDGALGTPQQMADTNQKGRLASPWLADVYNRASVKL